MRNERHELRVEMENTKKTYEQINKMIKKFMKNVIFQQPPFNEEVDDDEDEDSKFRGIKRSREFNI